MDLNYQSGLKYTQIFHSKAYIQKEPKLGFGSENKPSTNPEIDV
jgi:hypothetical protein